MSSKPCHNAEVGEGRRAFFFADRNFPSYNRFSGFPVGEGFELFCHRPTFFESKNACNPQYYTFDSKRSAKIFQKPIKGGGLRVFFLNDRGS